MIKKAKRTARLGNESSAFDGRVLLGLDRLGLNRGDGVRVGAHRARPGQARVEPGLATPRHVGLACRRVWLIGCEIADETARYCRECGAMGRVRSSWRRRFVHTPVGQSAVHLIVRVRRHECAACARSWTDDLSRMAGEGRRLTNQAVWWACAEIALKSKSVSACANDLHCSWGAPDRAVLEKGMDVLAADPRRLDGVESIGVDEHVWRHTVFGSCVLSSWGLLFVQCFSAV